MSTEGGAEALTSKDIAKLAGVSQATVSRVLHGNPNVRAETRSRVEAVLATTRYRPNAMARAMRMRKTGTVGVVVATVTNPFYPEVLEALSAEIAAADQRMILWNSEGPGEASAVAAIREGLVDGLVFTTVTPNSSALQEAIDHDAPVVLMNRTVDGLQCDQVATDNVSGGRHVAEYLMAHGHERVAFIVGPERISTVGEREQGLREGLEAAGAQLLPELRVSGFSHAAGHHAMRRLLQLSDPPTAVFAANDVTAFGAIDGARSLGRAVPDDVWVVGYDDIGMASWEAYDLTTVRQPITEMTRRAAELLLARIDHPRSPPQLERLTDHLVTRGSTAHAPFHHPRG